MSHQLFTSSFSCLLPEKNRVQSTHFTGCLECLCNISSVCEHVLVPFFPFVCVCVCDAPNMCKKSSMDLEYFCMVLHSVHRVVALSVCFHPDITALVDSA